MPGGGTLRSRTLEDVEKVKWDPSWGKERMHNMIGTRPDGWWKDPAINEVKET